jgi:putative peptidoglycan lipid II flippase
MDEGLQEPGGSRRPGERWGGGVAGAATLVGALSAVSLLLGFARDVIIAAVFGASAELDAYLVAQGLMNVVLGLVAGALAKAVVPVVAPAVAAGDPEGAHRSVATALAAAVLVLGAGAVVVGLLAGEVVAVLAPGFDAATAALAERLTRVVLAATVLIAATNVLAAVAQSHRRFFWAGVQGVPFNLVMIVAAGVFGPRYGVVALAVGFVVGSVARLLAQLVPLRRLGVRLLPVMDLRDPGFRTIARLVPPLLLGSAVGNVNTLVDRAVASAQGEGTIAALSYGWRVVSLADTLVVASFVAALYPAFGAAAAPAGRAELRRLVARGLTAVTLVLVPAVAGLVVAATPVVALVYGRGSFGPEAVALTATAVAWYAPGLLPLAWREVVTRAFYALGDSRTPVAVAVLAMAVNLAGDLTLGLVFGVPGIAASTVLSLVVAAVANTAQLARRHGAVDGQQVAGALGRLGLAGVAAAGAAAAALVVVEAAAGPAPASAGWDAGLRLAGVAVAVAVTYVVALALLRAPEAAMLSDGLRGAAARLRRRRRHGRRR